MQEAILASYVLLLGFANKVISVLEEKPVSHKY